MVEGLRVAYELSRLLRAQRMKRGALDFELPEAKVVLDDKTREPIDVTRRASDPGVKQGLPAHRGADAPGQRDGRSLVPGREASRRSTASTRRRTSRSSIASRRCASRSAIDFDIEDTRDPKKLGDLLKSFADHPLAPVLNSLLLRSMKQATYDVVNVGHFGLASKAYLHFTSPIRRYPDLVVHRTVHES